MNLRTLTDHILKEGGVSYSLTYGNLSGRKGYTVSPYKDREEKVSDSEFSANDLQAFIASNAELLAQDNHFIGAWVDNKIVYLDVSVLVASKKKALKMAKECNQLAIYNLTENKVIML